MNPNCDGGKCVFSDGEVRVLPVGGGGNAILCHECYLEEMKFRRERNEELTWKQTGTAFDLPTWDSLKVYDPS